MCKWCEDQACYFTNTSSGIQLVTLCPFCARSLQKPENNNNNNENNENNNGNSNEDDLNNYDKYDKHNNNNKTYLEVPGNRYLPDINERQNSSIRSVGNCGLRESLPQSLSSSTPRDVSPYRLPPIYGHHSNQPSSSPSLTQKLSPRSFAYLKQEFELARKTEDWTKVEEFFTDIHSNITVLCTTFKLDNSDVDVIKIQKVYDVLCRTPENVQSTTIKTIVSCFLTQQLTQTQELVNALLIVVLNPLFFNISNYLIFAHIMRKIGILNNHNLYMFIHLLTRLTETNFKSLLIKIQDFISCRLFPPSENQLPPIHKVTWWVPSAVKVISLLRAANNLKTPRLVTHLDFYVTAIDHINLFDVYNDWQNQTTPSKFSFCQYPFVISINAKKKILQQDSEQQMISVARNVLLEEVTSRSEPNIEMLFLNVNIRRSHLVSDSLNELSTKRKELKKKLKVSFIGEPGLDMGGLKKEWFLLLTREIFQSQYGMFNLDEQSMLYWFCNHPGRSLQEYNLVGKLMGLAVYNGINLDVRFPTICYKKLLSPVIVPYNDVNAVVGITKIQTADVVEAMPSIGKGLQDLLEYDGNVEEDFCLSFQISVSNEDNIVTKDLKMNGGNIPVANENRKEYVALYIDFLFNKNIYHQFQAFYLGFHSVCASNALIMLQPEEIELLVCGTPVFDMSLLKGIVEYDGYSCHSYTITHFWSIVLEEFSEEQQKQFLSFTTGSDRLPVGGIKEMDFKISRYEDVESLPMSHTCFNQLILPDYKDKDVLKRKITIAIQNAEGFGLK